MKKLIFTLIFTVAALGLAAQDGTAIVESRSVKLQSDRSGESFSINVSGFNFKFGKAADSAVSPEEGMEIVGVKMYKRRGRSIDVAPTFEFGFNYLLSPDYSAYPANTREFLDLNTGKSIHFGWSPVIVKASFNRRSIFGVTSGLTLVWRDYTFADESMSVAKENGRLIPVTIESNGRLKKSKLNTFALRVPLLLTITEPQSKLGVGLGGYVDFVTGAHTKYKFRKHKERGDFCVEPVQVGLQVRVRYKSVGMFANYGLSDMFQQDKAPATRPFTIGFGIGF